MLVALDAGHGGSDPGAVYNGRQEKDDNLRLAQAVGDILEKRGVNVVYTRTNDIYETPFKKATDANEAGADYFVSFHRNSVENPNTASGAQTLIYSAGGEKQRLADNIQKNLVDLGFKDMGVIERPNLVVLKRTNMPAVLIETGFINNDGDNAKFDREFDAIAQGIADGILDTVGYGDTVRTNARVQQAVSRFGEDEEDNNDLYSGFTNDRGDGIIKETRPWGERNVTPDADTDMGAGTDTDSVQNGNNGGQENDGESCVCSKLYRVQVGAFRSRENADRLLNSLLADGFPAFIIYSDGLYKVQVGAYQNLDNVVRMERRLRRFRYNTFITT
ncbi:MAG: N-acetylmuramoyl-L-alanine amidase [Butyrivibrio sp.]|nr:N-acetylmuramoyl-L-alanine amidase [Butyrivibrio sp.]